MFQSVQLIRHNIPVYGYRPQFGSYGTGPVASPTPAVSATSRTGGYPDIGNDDNELKLSNAQYHNTTRLISVIDGHNNKRLNASILGDNTRSTTAVDMGNLFQARFGATKKNPIYHMVREIVQDHDLGVNMRNLARSSIHHDRVPVGGESQQDRIWRQEVAAEHKAACYDLQTRTVDSLTERINELRMEGIPGAVQSMRLKKLRGRVQKDPFDFEGLDVETKEEPYWRLVDTEKKQLWLDCYQENVVAWYWHFRGVIDIKATIAQDPMKTYSMYEFAHVCDQMWNKVIAHDVYREERVQIANTHVRSMTVAVVTNADQNAYRKICGKFKDYFDGEEETRIDSLKHIMVPPRSFGTINGFLQEATNDYTTAATRKYRRENNA